MIEALNTKTGSVIVSVVLGLGLAALFRRACNEKGCLVIKAPPSAEIENHVYRIDDTCFQYTPIATPCKNS